MQLLLVSCPSQNIIISDSYLIQNNFHFRFVFENVGIQSLLLQSSSRVQNIEGSKCFEIIILAHTDIHC